MIEDFIAIKKIEKGDMSALEYIFTKYRDDVFRYAKMILHSDEMAEDITQDVFTEVVRSSDKYRVDINLKAWLLRIARNKSFNMYKRNSNCISIEESQLEEIPITTKEFDNIEFLDLIKMLDSTKQEIVILHLGYNIRLKDVATMLDKTPDCVRQQYKRALDLLKKHYAGGDDYELEKAN